MLNTFGNIFDEVIVRGQISTASGFHTDTTIKTYIDNAHRFAAGYHKWPFTEGRVSTTYTTTEEWSFEGYRADTFRILQVGGKRLSKLNFEDYQIFREEEPSANDRVFSDFGRLVYINPNIDASGTLTDWGQFIPAQIDITDTTATTVFSGIEEEGNEAIILETLSYIKTREMKPQEAQFYHQQAMAILEGIWKRVLDEQYAYQTHPDRGGIFKRFDVLKGRTTDELTKRDQF